MASATSATPGIDVLQCSSEELAKYLLEHRFENDGMATAAFLLEGTSALPDAEAIAAQLMGGSNEEEEEGAKNNSSNQSPKKEQVNMVSVSRSEEETASAPTTTTTTPSSLSLGRPLHSKPLELSLTNPRGKFHITFHEEGIHAVTIKNPQTLVIPAECVRDVILFPKPQDCQKVKSSSSSSKPSITSPMVLMCFQEQEEDDEEGDESKSNKEKASAAVVTFKGKPLTQICFQIPSSSMDGIQEALQWLGCDDNEYQNVETSWMGLLQYSLQIPKTQIFRVENPASTTKNTTTTWAFQSHQEANTSTTSGGMPFVKCYYGVQDGVLFPMQQGLLFFKPPLFLPRSKLHSIACGRGNGASSRYIDMAVITNADESLEFTNIHREEISVLNDYIHRVLIPAMQRDQAQAEQNSNNNHDTDNSSEEEAVAVAAVAVDDDDDDDAEMVVEAEAQAEGTRGRSKRRAAREAIQQTKQHFLQRGGAADDEQDDEDDSEGFSEGDTENDSSSDDEEEDEEHLVVAETKTNKRGKEVEEEDDEEDEEDEAEEEEDITESDAEATEDDDDDEDEASPPKAKKRKSG